MVGGVNRRAREPCPLEWAVLTPLLVRASTCAPILAELFLLLWLCVPSGFLIVIEKPNRGSLTIYLSLPMCTYARACTHGRSGRDGSMGAALMPNAVITSGGFQSLEDGPAPVVPLSSLTPRTQVHTCIHIPRRITSCVTCTRHIRKCTCILQLVSPCLLTLLQLQLLPPCPAHSSSPLSCTLPSPPPPTIFRAHGHVCSLQQCHRDLGPSASHGSPRGRGCGCARRTPHAHWAPVRQDHPAPGARQ